MLNDNNHYHDNFQAPMILSTPHHTITQSTSQLPNSHSPHFSHSNSFFLSSSPKLCPHQSYISSQHTSHLYPQVEEMKFSSEIVKKPTVSNSKTRPELNADTESNNTINLRERNDLQTQLLTTTGSFVALTSSRKERVDDVIRFHHMSCGDMKQKISGEFQKTSRSPQIKQKRRKKLWSESDMKRAIDLVIRFGVSCRGTAKRYNVPRSTLFSRLRKEKSLMSMETRNYQKDYVEELKLMTNEKKEV
jgi:hypothetical protein